MGSSQKDLVACQHYRTMLGVESLTVAVPLTTKVARLDTRSWAVLHRGVQLLLCL